MTRIIKTAIAAMALALAIQPSSAQTIKAKVKPANSIYELVYNGKDRSVYVASTRGNNGKAAIYRMDAGTLAVKDSIELETAVFGLGLNEKTQTLYGTATRGGAVLAIDLKTREVTTITNSAEKGHTREAVVDEANNRVYVSDVQGGIWVIDGGTNTFNRMLDGIPGATGLALDNGKNRIYAISKSKVLFYDLEANSVIDSFATGGERPINLALDAKGNRLFVSHQGSGTVTVLDATSGALLNTVTVGEGALGISYSPKTDRLFVANRGAGTTTVIDASNYNVVANLDTGSMPNTVVVDGKGNAYVSNKAKGGGRPKPGEKPAPVNDPDGDVVTLIGI